MIGEKIKYYRKSKNISQEELAYQCNHSTKFISNVETGKATPNYEDILAISLALNIDVYKLFDCNETVDLIYGKLSNCSKDTVNKILKIIDILTE